MGEEIVGRERELEALERFLSSAPHGACGLVLAGEPGIGKSTVWQAALPLAEQRGYRVATSRPAGSEATLTYAALGDLLADVADELAVALPTHSAGPSTSRCSGRRVPGGGLTAVPSRRRRWAP
jgi:hypothetical protein